MRARLAAAFEAAVDRLVERHAGYLMLGPIYVTSRHHAWSDGKNAFELGRDFQRGVHEGKLTEDGQVLR